MAIKLASLFVKLGADSAELTKALDTSTKRGRQFRRDMEAIGRKVDKALTVTSVAAVGLAGSMAAIYKSTSPVIDNLGKTADKLGTTTEGLQAARFAAELSGLSMSSLDNALQAMTRRVSEAADGLGAAKTAFTELGLDAAELEKLKPEDVLIRVQDELAKIPNQADRVRLAFQIFGREGVGVVNLTADTLRSARSDLDALGVSLTRLDVKKVEDANDQFARIGLVTQGLRQQLTVSMAEPFGAIANNIFEAAKQAGGFQLSIDTLVDTGLRGIGRVVGGVASALEFADNNPFLTSFGLVGLFVLGKKPAVVLGAIGGVVDKVRELTGEVVRTSEQTAGELRQTISDFESELVRLEAEQASAVTGIASARIQAQIDDLQTQLQIARDALVEVGLTGTEALKELGRAADEDAAGGLTSAAAAARSLSEQLLDPQSLREQSRALAELGLQRPNISVVQPETVTGDAANDGLADEHRRLVAAAEERERLLIEEQEHKARIIAAYRQNQFTRESAHEERLRQMRDRYFGYEKFQRQQINEVATLFASAGAADRVKILESEFGGLLDVFSTQSRTWFEINQALGISNAVVNVAEGITAALKLPPPASIFAAIKHAAIGAAQIIKIKQTKFSKSQTAPSVSGSAGGTAGEQNTSAGTIEEPSRFDADVQKSVTAYIFPPMGWTQDQVNETVAEAMRQGIEDGKIIPESRIVVNTRAA